MTPDNITRLKTKYINEDDPEVREMTWKKLLEIQAAMTSKVSKDNLQNWFNEQTTANKRAEETRAVMEEVKQVKQEMKENLNQVKNDLTAFKNEVQDMPEKTVMAMVHHATTAKRGRYGNGGGQPALKAQKTEPLAITDQEQTGQLAIADAATATSSSSSSSSSGTINTGGEDTRLPNMAKGAIESGVKELMAVYNIDIARVEFKGNGFWVQYD